jgi:osomolarity two-component system, sensor histidine kinase SLN1
MRVGIREQLAALGLFMTLVGIAVVTIPTWLFVQAFVVNVKTQDLAQTASVKASQVASQLDLLQSICRSITTRLLIQTALAGYYRGNLTQDQLNTAVGAEGCRDLIHLVLG